MNGSSSGAGHQSKDLLIFFHSFLCSGLETLDDFFLFYRLRQVASDTLALFYQFNEIHSCILFFTTGRFRIIYKTFTIGSRDAFQEVNLIKNKINQFQVCLY